MTAAPPTESRQRGLEERARPDRSVEASARRALEAIRAVQPAGPYYLAGYSFGGAVAFDMACRLEAVGEQVGLLAVLDSYAPGSGPSTSERFAARAAELRDEPTPRALQWAASSALAHAQRTVDIATAGIIPRRDLRQYYVFYRMALAPTRALPTRQDVFGTNSDRARVRRTRPTISGATSVGVRSSRDRCHTSTCPATTTR